MKLKQNLPKTFKEPWINEVMLLGFRNPLVCIVEGNDCICTFFSTEYSLGSPCDWYQIVWLENVINYDKLIELPFDWLIDWLIDWWHNVCVLDDMILGFCYINLTWETSGFELALTSTLEWQANQLTKCASNHKNWWTHQG